MGVYMFCFYTTSERDLNTEKEDVSSFERAPKLVITFWVSVVFLRGWGLTEVIIKSKILKIKGCGGDFLGFVGVCGGLWRFVRGGCIHF